MRGEQGLDSLDPGGLEIFSLEFGWLPCCSNQKKTAPSSARSLIPAFLSGIGNAYSDEILHAAQLSPITLTHKLKPQGDCNVSSRPHAPHLISGLANSHPKQRKNIPEGVTAFRPEWPCTAASANPARDAVKMQRIRYADNETNYCARCQTGGKLLADRSLSRLLGSDWPRTLDELEALKRA